MKRAGGSSGRRPAARWLACCARALMCCAAGLIGSSPAAFAGIASSLPSAEGSSGPSTLGGALVIPGSPMQGEQMHAAEEARRANPEAVFARERSRTEFEHLGASRAAKLAGEAFPSVVERRAGTLPQLPAGQKVVGYPADDAAQVALPGGKHGVTESTEPVAIETSRGHYEPLDLGLHEAGRAFQPARWGVGVRIPKRLADGVQLANTGVSLTPIGANGAALGGSEGSVDGATVLYANTQTDSDTVVKPLASGFEEDTLLRSVDSPSRLSFRMGLPAGARLVAAKDDSGAVDVVEAGTVLAAVQAASAQDAEGTVVPVSMSSSGDTLTVSVDRGAGDYRYPIEVDPTVEEKGGNEHEILYPRNWGFYTENSSLFHVSQVEETLGFRYVEDTVSKSVGTGEHAFFWYPTKGESRIYEITANTSFSGYAGGKMEDSLGIWNVHTSKYEANQTWIENYGAETTLCAESGCASGKVSSSNDESNIYYRQSEREANEWGGGTAKLNKATIDIVQEAGPSATLVVPSEWINASGKYAESVHAEASDPGLGVDGAEWSSSSDPGWHSGGSYGCVQCTAKESIYKTVDEAGFPEGEDPIEVTVKDPVGLSVTKTGTLKVDNAAPYNLAFSGLPPYNEISYGSYKLKASATDGSGTTPSSGVASIKVTIDGKELGSPNGSCSVPSGPCTATGEWTIHGEEYAAGKHTLVETATDRAGNVEKAETTLTIHAAESGSVGPGSVELASGAFTLNSTDVAIAAAGSGLSVERSYGSRRVAVKAEGPFGPQWQGLSFGGNESLTKLPTGSMVLTGSSGRQSLFAAEGSKLASPPGDANLTLKEEGTNTFTLTDQHGDVTTFTLPSGGSGTLFTPYRRTEPGHSGNVQYTFETVSGVTRPTQALAPVPAGVSCTTLVKGCRALTFTYASSTTATGEGPSEWGEYTGRLAKVSFTAYNPSSKAMQTTAVAQYAYDKQGRLRAEWDPRISPALKTTYGYDAEGHVTSVTPAAQQPWLMNYGTIESDATPGRLLSVTRPNVSTTAGEGLAPVDSTAPKLSTTSPAVGTEVTVTSGTWTHSPLGYGYQWEDCSALGLECAPIAGAVNPGYTPRYGDEGHTLVVVVSATNSGGTATASTAVSAVIPQAIYPPTYSFSFGTEGEGKLKSPSYVAIGEYQGQTTVYVTDTGNNRVVRFSTSGTYLGTLNTYSELKEPTGVAATRAGSHEGYVWVVSSGNRNALWYIDGDTEYKSLTLGGTGAFGGIGLDVETGGQIETGIVNRGENRVEPCWTGVYLECETGVVSGGSENGKFKEPAAAAWDPGSTYEGWYVADTGNNRVQCFSRLNHSELTYLGKFGEAGPGRGQLKEPKGLAIDGETNNIWVADTGNGRVEGFVPLSCKSSLSPEHAYLTQIGSKGSGPGQFNEPKGIAFVFGDMYVVDSANNRVEQWIPGKKPASGPLPPATPPNTGTSAVTTIEYHVPVSGAGAPYALGSAEIASWGQTEAPVEATAILPPDEPMGWPAKEYKRATVYYRDSKDRSTNVASPSGAIATTEYNAYNDVVRTLSPNNRAAALKEGGKSAETSKLLDTESKYNGETASEREKEEKETGGSVPGTRLLETLRPQHTVKLAGGTTAEARDHQQYFYDEGAPTEGAPYRLVTKVTDGAQYSGKEEDVRTTTTSYSGQSNLGWKLRKPTSVTTDPSGFKLTHTYTYESSTGEAKEVTSPMGDAANPPPAYNLKFGSGGTGNGQFSHPMQTAVDSSGNVWVADGYNNRVEKFSSSGTWLATYGKAGSKGEKEKEEPEFAEPVGIAISAKTGNVYVGDQGNDRVEELSGSTGKVVKVFGKGSSEGELKEPNGVAIDAKGNVWVVDVGADKIEEFNEEGKYLKSFGEKGTACGDFNGPSYIGASGESLYVSDDNDSRVEKFTEEGKKCTEFGSSGSGNGQFKYPTGIAVGQGGNVYVADNGNARVQEFSSTGTFLTSFGTKGTGNGQLEEPEGVAVTSSGAVYVTDAGSNNRVQEWVPNSGGAHITRTYYYSAGTEAELTACRSHPEWANLPCETKPVSQPVTAGLPELPVTTYASYNVWDEPTEAVETVGTTKRTKTMTYDAAGRLKTNAISSTVGTALPTTTYEYSSETGALVKQCANEGKACSEGKPKTITSAFNKLGELTSYTDADEATTTYEYEGEGSYKGAKELDARPRHVNDTKGAETYTYNETTGFLSELLNEYGTTKLPFTGDVRRRREHAHRGLSKRHDRQLHVQRDQQPDGAGIQKGNSLRRRKRKMHLVQRRGRPLDPRSVVGTGQHALASGLYV